MILTHSSKKENFPQVSHNLTGELKYKINNIIFDEEIFFFPKIISTFLFITNKKVFIQKFRFKDSF